MNQNILSELFRTDYEFDDNIRTAGQKGWKGYLHDPKNNLTEDRAKQIFNDMMVKDPSLRSDEMVIENLHRTPNGWSIRPVGDEQLTEKEKGNITEELKDIAKNIFDKSNLSKGRMKALNINDSDYELKLLAVLPEFQKAGNRKELDDLLSKQLFRLMSNLDNLDDDRYYTTKNDIQHQTKKLQAMKRDGFLCGQQLDAANNFLSSSDGEKEQMLEYERKTVNDNKKKVADQWKQYLSGGTYNDAFQYLMLNGMMTGYTYNKGIDENNPDNKSEIMYVEHSATTVERAPFEPDPSVVGLVQQKMTDGKYDKFNAPIAYAQAMDEMAKNTGILAGVDLNELNGYETVPVTEGKVNGRWIHFKNKDQSDDHKRDVRLLSALANKTPWCTKSSAGSQLMDGQHWTFVDNSNQPRATFYLDKDNQIREIRGILNGQGIEGDINPIVEKFNQQKQFPGGKNFIHEMKFKEQLRNLRDNAQKENRKVTKDELENVCKEYEYDIIYPYMNFDFQKIDPDNVYQGNIEIFEYEVKSDVDYGISNNLLEIMDMDIERSEEDKKILNEIYNDIKKLKAVNGNVRCPGLDDLGNIEEISRELYARHMKLKNLGKLRKVGSLGLDNTIIESLGNLEEVNGSLILQVSKIKNLGKLKKVGSLYLDNTNIESLGNLEEAGRVNLSDSKVKDLGKLKKAETLNLSGTEVESLGEVEEVFGELMLFGSKIKDLGKLKKVGDLNLAFTNIESLGELESARDLGLYDSKIKDLGKLKKVTNLDLAFTDIESLGQLEEVPGELSLNNSKVCDLGILREVGILDLSNSYITSLGNLEKVKQFLVLRDSDVKDLGHLKEVGFLNREGTTIVMYPHNTETMYYYDNLKQARNRYQRGEIRIEPPDEGYDRYKIVDSSTGKVLQYIGLEEVNDLTETKTASMKINSDVLSDLFRTEYPIPEQRTRTAGWKGYIHDPKNKLTEDRAKQIFNDMLVKDPTLQQEGISVDYLHRTPNGWSIRKEEEGKVSEESKNEMTKELLDIANKVVDKGVITKGRMKALGLNEQDYDWLILAVSPEFQKAGNRKELDELVKKNIQQLYDDLSDQTNSKYYTTKNDIQYQTKKLQNMKRDGYLFGQQLEAAERFLNSSDKDKEQMLEHERQTVNNSKMKIADQWKNYLSSGAYNEAFQYLTLKGMMTGYTYSKGIDENENELLYVPHSATSVERLPFEPDPAVVGFVQQQMADGAFKESYNAPMAYAKAIDEVAKKTGMLAGVDLNKLDGYETVPVTDGKVKGRWIHFKNVRKSEDHDRDVRLLSALANKTPWCTKSSADSQLTDGQHWVFVDNNNQPRATFYLDRDNSIREIRGILNGQGIEGDINPIVEKFNEQQQFPGGQNFIHEMKFKEQLRKLREQGIVNHDELKQLAADWDYVYEEGVNEYDKSLITNIDGKNVYPEYYDISVALPVIKSKVDYQFHEYNNLLDIMEIKDGGEYAYYDSIKTDIDVVESSMFMAKTHLDSLGNIQKMKNGIFPHSSLEDLGKLEEAKTLDLRATKIKTLKNLNKVDEIDLSSSEIRDLGKLEAVNVISVSNTQHLESLGNLRSAGDVTVRDSNVKDLGNLTVVGDLHMRNSKIESLGKVVEADKIEAGGSKLRDLGNLKHAEQVYLDSTLVESLGKLQDAGEITLFNTPIKDLGDLEKVGKIKLSETKELKSLGKLKVAEQILLGNSNIEDLGELNQVADLDLEKTHIKSLGKLQKAGVIKLKENTELEDLGELSEVNNLHLQNTGIKSLGNNIKEVAYIQLQNSFIVDLGSLERVGKVDFDHTDGPKQFADNTGVIDLSFTEIQSLGKLKEATVVNLKYCRSLKDLGNLTSVENLDVGGSSLTSLGDKLKVALGMYANDSMLEDVGALEKAGSMTIVNTPLTSLGNMQHLQYLDATGSKLKDLGKIKNIGYLTLNKTPIETLGPNLETAGEITMNNHKFIKDLGLLQTVDILNAEGSTLENLGKLNYADSINVGHCQNLKSIGDLQTVKERLVAVNTPNLESLGNLEEVMELFINDSGTKDLGKLKNVLNLIAMDTPNLKSLGTLETAEFVDLKNSGIKDLGNLHTVGTINLFGSSIENLGKLKKVNGFLDLHDSAIKDLGDLEQVNSIDLSNTTIMMLPKSLANSRVSNQFNTMLRTARMMYKDKSIRIEPPDEGSTRYKIVSGFTGEVQQYVSKEEADMLL